MSSQLNNMNGLIGTEALISWTGINDVFELKRHLEKLGVVYSEIDSKSIITTLASVDRAFLVFPASKTCSDLIDIRQVIKLVGKSKSTIQRMIESEKFPTPDTGRGRGKTRLWKKLSILQWVDNQRN